MPVGVLFSSSLNIVYMPQVDFIVFIVILENFSSVLLVLYLLLNLIVYLPFLSCYKALSKFIIFSSTSFKLLKKNISC